MEKSMDLSNKKVRIDIPDDLALSILSKTSLKSLNRLGCVRKSWSLLFQNRYFMSLFYSNILSQNLSSYVDKSLLLHKKIPIDDSDGKHVLYSLSGERYEKKTLLDWPNPFEEDGPDFHISGSGSINGILCLIRHFESNNRVVLWNPATKEFKVIPTSPSQSVPNIILNIDLYGFGYDSVKDDYKVIQQVICDIESDYDGDLSSDPFWEVYSLRTNSWTKFEFDHIPINYDRKGVCLNGMYHWWGVNESFFDEDYALYLVSFDLSNDTFLTTFIPSEDDSLDLEDAQSELMVLNGYIALISNHEKEHTFYISALGEIGVKESWIKLFSFCYAPNFDYPIGAGKKGDIFFTEGCKLMSFNLNTHMIEDIDYGELKYWNTLVFKGSLLPIGETNI